MSLLEVHCRLRYSTGLVIEPSFRTDAAVTALFGPSGSGKTSVLSIIAGLRRPESGQVRLGDRLLYDHEAGINLAPERRRIGYVFQDHLLFPHLDVRRNLLYGRDRRPAAARKIELDRVVQVLELGDLLARRPHTLSGGQKQRVALGRALLTGPELLLLDEPLAALDEELKGRVLDYVEQVIHEWQIPTIYVTHNPREVHRLARWVVVLASGKVRSVGPPEQLLGKTTPRPEVGG